MSGRKKGLGRGLSALMNDTGLADADTPVELETKSAEPPRVLGETGEEARLIETLIDTRDPSSAIEKTTDTPGIAHVSISRLRRNPDQPRKVFDRNQLDDLIASIQQKGVLQPVLVRPLSENRNTNYQIVAGERRWQAAMKAGLTSIPILIRELSDRDVLEIGVIENVQRADLNPMEEALAYQKLISEFGRTQAEIATTIGKSRAHVANTVRLTSLTERARGLLMNGRISAGHARAILAAEDPNALAEAILREEMSVRQAEQWVKDERKPDKPARTRKEKQTDIAALEQRLRDESGLTADIRHGARGGEIRLKYKDLKEMDTLLARLGLPRS
ncbi:MAG: ParB/RepB/Spo0J family partition protein [Litorimonas sp.]